MSVAVEEIKKLKEEFLNVKEMTMKRYDGCGTLHEEWNVEIQRVYNIVESTHEDDSYGNLYFKIKWNGKRKQ
jgi:hypothetical protein